MHKRSCNWYCIQRPSFSPSLTQVLKPKCKFRWTHLCSVMCCDSFLSQLHCLSNLERSKHNITGTNMIFQHVEKVKKTKKTIFLSFFLSSTNFKSSNISSFQPCWDHTVILYSVLKTIVSINNNNCNIQYLWQNAMLYF